VKTDKKLRWDEPPVPEPYVQARRQIRAENRLVPDGALKPHSANWPALARLPDNETTLIEPLVVFSPQSLFGLKCPPALAESFVQAALDAFGLWNVPKPAQQEYTSYVLADAGVGSAAVSRAETRVGRRSRFMLPSVAVVVVRPCITRVGGQNFAPLIGGRLRRLKRDPGLVTRFMDDQAIVPSRAGVSRAAR
jgi:hypothetical protein